MAGEGATNAAGMLLETAAAMPARPAIVEGEQSRSYEELARDALAIAAGLREDGVQPGDRVAIHLRRGATAAAAYFGALASGAVAVIVNEQLQPRQIEHILNHSGAVAMIAEEELAGRLDRPLETGARTLDGAGLLGGRPVDEAVQREGGDVAQIIYTSGSTGLPKGVTLSHSNVWAGMQAVTAYLEITAEDRIASLLPFSFDYGLNQLLCAAGTGACLVVERSPVAARIVRSLNEREATVLAAVPPLWFQLLDTDSFQQPIESLRAMTNSGGRLPKEAVAALRQAQPGAGLILMYGLTEAFRSTYLPADEVDSKPTSIGRAIPGAEIMVLDEEMAPCGPGEHGQLVHRGPTVALGYWQDSDATERVYGPNPLRPEEDERVVFSGDLVYRDEDGDLFFVGRNDSMIKTMGYRVSPDEVAEVLYASGQVVEALVTSEPDAKKGAIVVAYVVLREDGSLERVQELAAQELPRYMRPARIEDRAELPRTASGKHDAKAMREGQ